MSSKNTRSSARRVAQAAPSDNSSGQPHTVVAVTATPTAVHSSILQAAPATIPATVPANPASAKPAKPTSSSLSSPPSHKRKITPEHNSSNLERIQSAAPSSLHSTKRQKVRHRPLSPQSHTNTTLRHEASQKPIMSTSRYVRTCSAGSCLLCINGHGMAVVLHQANKTNTKQ